MREENGSNSFKTTKATLNLVDLEHTFLLVNLQTLALNSIYLENKMADEGHIDISNADNRGQHCQ